jgi:Peptidase propeptide and YPEB domain
MSDFEIALVSVDCFSAPHSSESIKIWVLRGCLKSLMQGRSGILIIALSAFGISSGVTSDKNEAKHSSKITKTRAERIALTKVPGGSIRSAELETARGRRFWSVYIAKPGSKNAKEIRVDAKSGQILAVQTERPGDQAEEPPKNH